MTFSVSLSADYVKNKYFTGQAYEFAGPSGVFFYGPYQEFGFNFYPTGQDVDHFVERQNGRGELMRRAQKNNRTSLSNLTLTTDGSINFRLKEFFADLPKEE